MDLKKIQAATGVAFFVFVLLSRNRYVRVTTVHPLCSLTQLRHNLPMLCLIQSIQMGQ